MANTKNTKRDYFTALKNFLEEVEEVNGIPATELVDFLNSQLTQLDARNAKAKKRAAEKRVEGDELRATIKAVLTAEPKTVADIMAQVESEDLTPAKVVARLNQLVKAEEVVKEPVKVDARRLMAYRIAE